MTASTVTSAPKKRAKLDISSAAKPQLRLDLTSTVPPPEEFDNSWVDPRVDPRVEPPGDLVDLTTDRLHHSPVHTCGRKTPASPDKKQAQEQLQRDRLEILGPGKTFFL